MFEENESAQLLIQVQVHKSHVNGWPRDRCAREKRG